MGFFEKFFGNIGKKMKALAKWSFVVESILLILAGLICWINGLLVSYNGIVFSVLGWCLILIGPILAWVSSWMLYGFGELIDKTCDIEKNTRNLYSAGSDYTYGANEQSTNSYYNANNGYNANSGYNTSHATAQPTATPDPVAERNARIESLRARGLITEEEYQRAISREW